MTTSGSYNFVINRGDLRQKSAEEIGAVEVGGTMPSEMEAFFNTQLNLMLKNWHGASLTDLFRLRRTVLLPELDTVRYSLGGSTGNFRWVFEDDLTETYVNADQSISGGTTAITVDSTTGMAVSDQVGVEMEDSSIQWTTVATIPSSTTFTPADNWNDDVDNDDRVFFYTTGAPRPYAITNAWRRTRSDATQSTASDRQGHDTRMRIMSREQYLRLGQKRSEGEPIELYYDPQVGNTPASRVGELYLFPEPTDVGVTIRTYSVYEWDDMDLDVDDFSCPPHWYLPIMLGLSRRGYNAYGTPSRMRTDINGQFGEAWLNAISVRNLGGSMFLAPDEEGVIV